MKPRASRSRRETVEPSDTASVSSRGVSTRDHSAIDLVDTPSTSYAPTPAEYKADRKGKGKARMSLAVEAISISSKRKRSTRLLEFDSTEMNTSGDAELARALQEEEYGGGSFKKAKFIDSEEDSDQGELNSELSEPVSDDDLSSAMTVDSVEPVKARKRSSAPTSGKGKGRALPIRQRPSRSKNRKDAAPPTDLLDVESVADPDEEEFVLSEASSGSELSDLDEAQFAEFAGGEDDDDDEDDVPLASTRSRNSTGRRQLSSRQRARLLRRERKPRLDPRERKRRNLEKSHPELLTMWITLAAEAVITPVAAKQPASISRRLKEFQLEGLDWMIRQEQTKYKGGLLGDEMGMGKTIQAVSLIMSDYPAKDPTLVLVPPVALMQWQNEIGEYTDGKLKVLIVHGSNSKSKNLTVKDYKKFDVIIVSYNTLESLYRKEMKGWARGENIVKEKSPLHAIHFHRLILDEAHCIKTRTTGVAKACFALKGTYKWCLSGTPVQNRIGEFFSLLRFLEVRPFADYFCEKCPCAQLQWELTEDYKCTKCGHSGAEHASVFNQELLNPITGDDADIRSKALDNLHLITARVMLRRMKRDHTSSMELPPKEVIIHNEFFGEIERDFSNSIMTNTSRRFDTYVSQGVMLNNYANIFGLIMQMRQVANHPDLLLRKSAQGGQNVLVCNICDEAAEEAIRSRCHHEFCRSCVRSYVESCEGNDITADCPRCHIPLTIDWEQPEIEQDEEMVKKNSIINRIKMENWTSSTKIEMLVYDLYKLRSKKQTLKSIVFSQFTSMLQLIEWRLRRAGFNTVMLDGSMTPVQRQRSIDYFMNNADVEVFLVSLKAGGVALNLVEASRVFIVDP